VISITDGQGYIFKGDLFNAIIRPAINVGFVSQPRWRQRPDQAMHLVAGITSGSTWRRVGNWQPSHSSVPILIRLPNNS